MLRYLICVYNTYLAVKSLILLSITVSNF